MRPTTFDAGLMTSLPASDPGSAAVWGSKRINPRPQSCLCLAWSGYPSYDDDDETYLKFTESKSFANPRLNSATLKHWFKNHLHILHANCYKTKR